MSMLAEPRRKQKIINLRAKNNAWSNDTNKFGQRMLEKMGWSSGKGLGAKENGIVEHVVARYKNDEKGLGYEDKNDQWTKHEDDFNALLANLSNDKDSGTEVLHSGVSLEKKSKKSKARIHYHKFTRGKDISRYSEKDLANIFGKKSFHNKSENVEETVKDEDETVEKVFTERGSMEDYFKSKMAALKSKNKITPSFNDNSNNNYCDFAFRGFSCTNGDGNSNENPENNLNNPVDSQDINQGSQIEKIPKKVKKKKSKNKETVSDSENKEADYIFQGFSNSESVGGMYVDSKADLTEDSREKSFVAKKDKKKKKKAKNNDINVEENITEEVVIKEGKKKRNTEIDTEIDKSCLVEQDIDDEGAPKKKKKRKNKDL